MAFDALKAGLSLPLVYNGANEAAVEAFCDGRIGFMDIERVVDYTLNQHSPIDANTLADIVETDRFVRQKAEERIAVIALER